MAEGDELPPVVAALVGDDSSFMEMIARDVEMAEQFKADLEAALGGSGEVSVSGEVTGAEEIPAEMAAIGDEAAAAVTEPIVEGLAELPVDMDAALAEINASTEAFFTEQEATARTGGAEVGAALGEGMAEGAEAAVERASELIAAGLDEQAQAIMEQLPSLVVPAAQAAGQQIGAAVAAGVDEGLEGGEAAAVAFVDDLVARVKVGALTASQAIDVLAGDEMRSTATMSTAIAQLTGTWATAQQALEEYGTAEATVIQTTALLTEAEDELLGSQTALLLMTQMMAQGSEFDAEMQISTLQEVADAQAGVTSAIQAQVAAQTELNYAVLQEETALMDETSSMRALQVAAEAVGVTAEDLTLSIQAGQAVGLSAAASTAQQAIQSNLLAEAQTRLAAANITLVDTYASLAAGEEVSAEAQRAVLAGAASAQKDVAGLGGELGNVGKSAESAAAGMGGMASIMYGPLGMALYPLMMVLPMLSGMFTSSAVSASVFTAAVSQDSNAVGDNTAATIQSTLASSNLNDISKQLGLSQAQLIEYAAGEKNVQDQVTAAYEAKTKALEDSETASKTTAGRSGSNATDPNAVALSQLEAQKQALDAVTDAVAAAVTQDAANSAALLAAEQTTQIYNASVDALGESMLLNVQSTKMSNQATVEFGSRLLAAESDASYMAAAVGAAGVNLLLQANATQITNEATAAYGAQVLWAESSVSYMTAAMDASAASARESALTSSYASVGLLNLGDSQVLLNAQLSASETQYTEASGAAGAYGAALTSLSGTVNNLLGSEAAFTTSLAGLTTSIQTNGDSLDVNTAKGAANITTVTGIADAADKAAESVYQNEVTTKGATVAYQDANTKLAQEEQAFIAAAEKAGMHKQAVQQLAAELFKLPPVTQLAIDLNTGPAEANLAEILRRIDSSSGTITVYENSSGTVGSTGGTIKARAGGGPVEAGETYWVGEHGKELVQFGANGFVTPHEQLQPALAGGGSGGYGSSGGAAPVVNVTVLLDSREITASVRSEAQQYKTRNSMTGFN